MCRRLGLVLVLAGILVFVGALSGAEDMPGADGEALWDYISETSPYRQWETWPGYPDMYEGKSPHGAYLKLFANPVAIEAARVGKPMPAGAILVKENYGDDQKTLMAITPMYKVSEYNPEAGDWFWAKYGPDGEVMKAGKVRGCINCHGVKKDQDWIFTQPK